MSFRTEHVFYNPTKGAVRVEIGQHFMVEDKKGYAVNLGRKFVAVKLYGGKTVKVDPLDCRPLDTCHN